MAFDLPPAADIPPWLTALSPATMKEERPPLENLLENSLYYPASGTDGDPVKYLGGFVFSFVYVDYGNTHEKWMTEIQRPGFRGYHVLATRPVIDSELSPYDWAPNLPSKLLEYEGKGPPGVPNPFCEWSVFERNRDVAVDHGPQRFSLLYLRAEGVSAFKSLYVENGISPSVVAVIQPGGGLGCNWTYFSDEKAAFARSVLGNRAGKPSYLLYGGIGRSNDYCGSCWSSYKKSRGFIRRPENEYGTVRRIGLWSEN